MQEIVLINPPFIRTCTYSITYYKNPYPNLSFAYLAGFLEANNVPVTVIDGKFLKLTFNDILDKIKKIKPRIIGFTSMTTEIIDVHKLISATREISPDSIIVLGGVHASALPFETIKSNEKLDIVAMGEGEEILLELCNGVPLGRIQSIYYRDNSEIKSIGNRVAKDLDGYGCSAFHLWPTASYYHVSTYRGCPFSCSFCFRVFGSRIRLRKLEDVVKDIEYVASRGAFLDICDSTFGLNKVHTKSILNEIIHREIKVSWSAATRVDIADKPLLQLMKEAGAATVAFGIESGSNRILKYTGKNTSIEKAKRAVKVAKDIGLKTTGYYIFGHPDETKEEVRQTMNMIWKTNTDEAIIGIMTPWPGTKVYELANDSRGGYTLLHKNYAEYDKHYGYALEFDNYSMRWLELMRAFSYFNLYIKNYRFLHLINFFWGRRNNILKKIRSLRKILASL